MLRLGFKLFLHKNQLSFGLIWFLHRFNWFTFSKSIQSGGILIIVYVTTLRDKWANAKAKLQMKLEKTFLASEQKS
jgi:hypothetical protein